MAQAITIGLQLGGMALNAIGKVKQGKAEKAAAYRAALVDEENARLSVMQGEEDAMSVYREERQAAGEALVSNTGSGILISGSVTTVLENSAYQAELDVLRVRNKAARDAQNLMAQAAERRQAGDNAKSQAIWGAVSDTVSGLGSMLGQMRSGKQASSESSSKLGGTSGYGGS